MEAILLWMHEHARLSSSKHAAHDTRVGFLTENFSGMRMSFLHNREVSLYMDPDALNPPKFYVVW
jgi:hypothetical protein